ncbi:hypothetical protein DPQ33_02920 [Oceanidesulfovibrio indonesiensis]|uniref:Glycosyltransferase subfamily 4-like N-terminal domain-containing protein n=1 Tax=Oceanidesulfovibrio indonesiensis TaxID=54767 RepID=A0A7M3MIQ4_9BACT|nr:glycosyltransferase [Oceanidesulfovibrio indonesiensis]TVM19327.1 hypothetical protein DPQ33_02920 [Oceanidesulfovibrio indonesiensis]
MARTRVFLVVPSLAPGGSETVLLRLAACLDRERFEPEVVALAGAGPLAAELPPDVPLHDLAAGRVAAALPKFIRLARRRRPGVILSFQMHTNLALLLARPLLPRRVRIVAREESMPSRSCAESPLPRLFGLLMRRLYPKAQAVITQCEAAAEELTSHYGVPEDMIRAIPNPVDIQDMRKRARAEMTQAELPPAPRIVFVGRLAAVKRVDVILEAVARMRRRASLVVVGGGSEDTTRSLKDRAASLGMADRVLFTGHQPNPFPYVGHADLLALASLREGFNLAVLEARALGVPAVVPAAPGCLPEMISHGTNGFLAPFFEDSERQADALAATLDHALEALAGNPDALDMDAGSGRWSLEAVCRAHEELL